MKKLDSIAIIGVGLIGASIGLAVRQRALAGTIIGIGRAGSRSLTKAKDLGVVTKITSDVQAGAAAADLVVVCTPVDTIVQYSQAALDAIAPDGLVTDAGSTKGTIVQQMEAHPDAVRFVGSHPMAGSHKSGPEYGDADLFIDRPVVVTPSPTSNETHVAQIEAFWRALGARTIRMSADEHDNAVANISHLPHVIASALAAATSAEHLPLASSGWADTTRVAGGEVELWLQILNDNRDHVLKSLDKFGKVLASFREALAAGEDDRLRELLEAGKQTRDRMEEPS